MACHQSLTRKKWCMARVNVYDRDVITITKLVTVFNARSQNSHYFFLYLKIYFSRI